MNVKMMQRAGRVLVCLLLVCCILINCSPIRAKALGPETILVPVLRAVTSTMISLGIQAGADAAAHSEVANQIVEALEAAGEFVAGGMVSALLIAGSDGVARSYLARDFVEWIRNWCFENNYVFDSLTGGVRVPAGERSYTTASAYAIYDYDVVRFATQQGSSSYYIYTVCAIAGASLYVKNSGGSTQTVAPGTSGYAHQVKTGASLSVINDLGLPIFDNRTSNYDAQTLISMFVAGSLGFDSGVGVATDYDLTLGDVALSDQEIKDGYVDWAANVQEVTSDEDETVTTTYYPVSIADTDEQAQSMTQAEAQAGTISEELADSLSGALEETFDGTVAATPWATFTNWLADAISTPISSAADLIISAVQAIFIPAEGYINTKVEALTTEFAFADSIATTGTELKSFLLNMGSQPPIIYIDLGATEGSYDIGGKTVFIDLTWYEQYKGTVDAILSAFIYLWFAWRMYLSLPGIIAGTSGFWGPLDPAVDSGFRPWPPMQSRLGSGDGKIYSGPASVPPERRLGWRNWDIRERDMRNKQ